MAMQSKLKCGNNVTKVLFWWFSYCVTEKIKIDEIESAECQPNPQQPK